MFQYNLQGDRLAKVPYQVVIDGMPYAAKVNTQKDRFGNLTYVATVVNSAGNTIGLGYGDTPYEACDAAGGR